MFISYWQTKTLKRIQNALYWETEQHYQKTCALSVFQLVIIKIFKIYVKHLISGNETTFPETCCFVTFKHSRHLTLEKKKDMENTLYRKTKQLYQKTFFVCFELITYRNSKMRRNHPLLKKQKNVRKKCFDFFSWAY